MFTLEKVKKLSKTKILIPFRLNNDGNRLDNLNSVLAILESYHLDISIEIIEQDVVQRLTNSTFIFSDKEFNKSWALNFGVKKSINEGYDKVILWDADFILEKQYLEKMIKDLDSYDCISPYDQKVTYLTTEQSKEFRSTLDLSYLETLPERRELRAGTIPFAAGIIGFRSESFKLIGGYNEEFFGWGGEDDEVSIRIEKCLSSKCFLDGRSYHLYHKSPLTITSWKVSERIVNTSVKSKLDILNKSKETWDLLGLENKFR